MKLLAPAGTLLQAETAIKNGADAIYVGAPGFNARRMLAQKNGINSPSDLLSLIEYVKSHGKEIHIALNIIVKDKELAQAFKQIELYARYGANVFIFQDWGVMFEARKLFPEITIHASTQAAVSNRFGAKFLYEKGINGIILPRETRKNTIFEIRKELPNIDIESFVHGALCFSYSGQCYFSAFIGARSGNRGLCGQPCRRFYKTERKEGYLFSCKDLALIEELAFLKEVGVKYLKIEGRAKSPEYTALVVKKYREALDTENYKFTPELNFVFNRGYTKGFFKNEEKDIINSEWISHRGIKCGEVVKKDKNGIYIKANLPLSEGDGLFFENYGNGLVIISLEKRGEFFYIKTDAKIFPGDIVYKNKDGKVPNNLFIPKETEITGENISFSYKKWKFSFKIAKKEEKTAFFIIADSEKKIDYLKNAGEKNIFASFLSKNKNIGLKLPFGEKEYNQFSGYKRYIVNNIDEYAVFSKNACTIPYFNMNIYNSFSAKYFNKFVISIESGIDEILKNRYRNRAIVYIDGPLPLMFSHNKLQETEYFDRNGHSFFMKSGVLYNEKRLLLIDFLPRLFGKIGGFIYNSEFESFEIFEKKYLLYRKIIKKLEAGQNIAEEKEFIKSFLPYTKGVATNGVI